MKQIGTLIGASVLAFFAGPGAAQPYSQSMAQCAALYQNAAQWMTSEDRAERLMVMTRRFHAASVEQAQSEGVADAEAAMTREMDRRTEEWEAQGAAFLGSQDFRDWAAYCRKFGASQGIDVNL